MALRRYPPRRDRRSINHTQIMHWQTFISTLAGGLITYSAILLTNALDLGKRKRTHESQLTGDALRQDPGRNRREARGIRSSDCNKCDDPEPIQDRAMPKPVRSDDQQKGNLSPRFVSNEDLKILYA